MVAHSQHEELVLLLFRLMALRHQVEQIKLERLMAFVPIIGI